METHDELTPGFFYDLKGTFPIFHSSCRNPSFRSENPFMYVGEHTTEQLQYVFRFAGLSEEGYLLEVDIEPCSLCLAKPAKRENTGELRVYNTHDIREHLITDYAGQEPRHLPKGGLEFLKRVATLAQPYKESMERLENAEVTRQFLDTTAGRRPDSTHRDIADGLRILFR